MAKRKLIKKKALKGKQFKKSKVLPKAVASKVKFNPAVLLVIASLGMLVVVLVLFFQQGFGFNQYTCNGIAPENSIVCTKDNKELTKNETLVLSPFCTAEIKCEYVCKVGYKKFENRCVGENSSVNSCYGSIPQNASICEADNLDLLWNAPNVLVSSCTANKKCEYLCATGFVERENLCVRKYCVPTEKLNLKSAVFAIASESSDLFSGVSPLGERSNYFLIFDKNIFVGAAKNPYSQGGIGSEKELAEWLVDKNVTNVVLADESEELDLQLGVAGLNCLEITGKVAALTGRDENITGVNPYATKYGPSDSNNGSGLLPNTSTIK